MLTFATTPDPPSIDPMGAGSYSAPAMWDDEEWASPTPCHLEWIIRRIAQLEVKGRLEVDCPACAKAWTVICEPGQRGHAVWVEA
jgi:hypothetical protein